MITDAHSKEIISKYLASKIDTQHYGKVIIVFQNGKVTHIIEEKSMVLDTLNN